MDQASEKSASIDKEPACTCLKSERQTYRSVTWWSLYKQDIARYKQHRKHASILNLCLTEQGLWALLQYRVASALYRSVTTISREAAFISPDALCGRSQSKSRRASHFPIKPRLGRASISVTTAILLSVLMP